MRPTWRRHQRFEALAVGARGARERERARDREQRPGGIAQVEPTPRAFAPIIWPALEVRVDVGEPLVSGASLVDLPGALEQCAQPVPARARGWSVEQRAQRPEVCHAVGLIRRCWCAGCCHPCWLRVIPSFIVGGSSRRG